MREDASERSSDTAPTSGVGADSGGQPSRPDKRSTPDRVQMAGGSGDLRGVENLPSAAILAFVITTHGPVP